MLTLGEQVQSRATVNKEWKQFCAICESGYRIVPINAISLDNVSSVLASQVGGRDDLRCSR